MDFFRSRNFLLSTIVLAFCLIITGTFAIYKKTEFDQAGEMLDQTSAIIYETQDLSNKILSLIAIQRGYLLTRNESFTQQYLIQQKEISRSFEKLQSFVDNNPAYANEILDLQTSYIDLVELLDERTADADNTDLSNVEDLETLKQDIRDTRNALLDEKYATMNQRINAIGQIQERLIFGLLIGIFFTGIILTALNYYMFRLRRQNRLIGKDLFNSEERLQYAMMASGEGVYDWDIESGYFYFSKFFVDMLGYEIEECAPHIEVFQSMIHKDDYAQVMDYVNQYIDDNLSEFSIDFRMRTSSDQYIWINSRAFAIRDEDGKAVRLVGVHRNITEHKMVEQNLEQEAMQAEQIAEAKGQFLAHMSHEIRTPLTSITGIAEILQRKQDDFNDRQRELVNTLAASAKSLKELVNDILDFSRIEKGEVELENQPFLLGNLLSEIVNIMHVPANERGLNFKVLYDDIKYYEYYGDEARIRQILINLIGNAIKFTDEGTITVMATVEEIKGIEYLAFAVQDTGIGINDEMFDQVFLEFKQEDSSISRKYGGTGLGLPISKKLAALMGGDLQVESRKGLGSTFTLYLPIENRGLKLIDNDDLQLQGSLNEKLSSLIQKEQCALIVEDYEGNVVILSYLMEEIGLDFEVARTGKEALEKWKTRHYDLILMDVQMPEMDGLTATKTIREMEKENKFEPTPILGMTAHALIQDKDKCIEAGMSDYISKPINSELLKEKIFTFIQSDNVRTNISSNEKTGT